MTEPEYVIYAVNVSATSQPIRRWIREFEPEAMGGLGNVEFTDDPGQAMHFPSMANALIYVMTQSQTRPLRDDGLPNRPLRSFSILIQSTQEAKELAHGIAQVPPLRPVD